MQTLTNIDRLLEINEEAAKIKVEQREVAKNYIRKIVEIFGFSAPEIFEEEKEHFRDGSLEKLRALFAKDVNITRKDFIAKAVEMGLNERTAGTQHHRIRHATTFVPDAAYEFGYQQDEFVPVIAKERFGNGVQDDDCEVVLFETKLNEAAKKYCITYHALSQYLTEAIHWTDDLEEAKALYQKELKETKENMKLKAAKKGKK